MNNEMILKKLENIYFELTRQNIKLDESMNLILDLGMTSLMFLYMMLKIEKVFEVNIDELSYCSFQTVSDIVNFIKN